MPDEFKVVVVRLFELLREKTNSQNAGDSEGSLENTPAKALVAEGICGEQDADRAEEALEKSEVSQSQK